MNDYYSQYCEALKKIECTGRLMPFNWAGLPSTLPFRWAAYASMIDEFSSELANSVNALTCYTHRLKGWRDVVETVDQQGKLDIAVEFVDPLATIALNLPYVIRSRFIFASAHLCNQASMSTVAGWTDDLPLDRDLYFEQADRTGKPWRKYSKLKLKLERLSDKAYQDKTLDFRNRYNHRFSPRIVVGVTGLVTRRVDPATSQVSYGFGQTGPLTLPVVTKLLEEQCKSCYAVFDAFQELVQEHLKVIVPAATAELGAMAALSESPSSPLDSSRRRGDV